MSITTKMSVDDVKRKAEKSPETDITQPRLRRRGSLPDLHEPKSMSVPEIVKRGFMDPGVIKDVIPVITACLQPQIEKTIELAFASTIDSAVNKAIEKFKTDIMQPMLKHKDDEITELKNKLEQKNQKISDLETKVVKLEKSHKDLEQYGRRQSIRLNNVQLPDIADCEQVVLNVLNKAMPIHGKINADETERFHPIGKPNRKGNRQVIVKFLSYKTKARVYDARFNLRNVYMTEDLTKSNQAIASLLLKSKKAKKVLKFWSRDAKFFAKAHMLQPAFRIKTESDVEDMIIDALDRGLLLENHDDIDSESEADMGEVLATGLMGATQGASGMD